MNKKTQMVAGLSLALSLIAAGCSGGVAEKPAANGGSAAPTETSKPKEAEKPKEPEDITVYSASGSTVEALMTQYGNAIKAKFPYVNLKFIPKAANSSIEDLIASNTAVDLIFGSVGTFNASIKNVKMEYDLTNTIQTKKFDLNRLEPTLIDMQRKLADDGKALYGLPVWVAVSGLYYNKDLFDKFGVEYPKDNMKWSEVLNLAKRMTRQEGGTQYYGYVTSPQHQFLTNQWSLEPVDPKALKSNLNSDPFRKFMQSITQFYTDTGASMTKAELDIATQRNMFEKDMRVAMYTNYSGGTPPETMKWDVVNVPAYDEFPGVGPQVYPNYWYIAGSSKHKDTAFDIMTFLDSDEFQTTNNRNGYATVLKNQEIRKQFGQNMEKFKGKNVLAMFPAKQANPLTYTEFTDFSAAQFNAAFVSVVTKEKDLNTALRDAADAVDKQIATVQATKK
ncbi:MAG: extracellular solute-binding protein family 1 [Paenibacillus sp.]|jgi:multiple sugar transport system substrate-binding protein|nr:extracellular solute-binding protein family 1 [Paenibacillus sp.]